MAPVFLFLASSIALAAGQDGAGPRREAPPVGGWSFAPDGCDAGTGFAGGASLSISYDRDRDRAFVMLWDPALRAIRDGAHYRVALRFSAVSEFVTDEAVAWRIEAPGDRRYGLSFLAPGRDFVERVGAAAAVVISVGPDRIGARPLPGARDAMARLIRCAAERRAGDPRRANLASYFSADDYPPAALSNREHGTVGFRLIIGPDGLVSDCMVTSSSRSAALDEATCRLLRERARYRPARDALGNPTTGSDEGSVTWTLPRRR